MIVHLHYSIVPNYYLLTVVYKTSAVNALCNKNFIDCQSIIFNPRYIHKTRLLVIIVL